MRAFIQELHQAEAKIRASLSGEVKFLSREEIDAIAPELRPPVRKKADYRRSHYAER